MTNITIVKSLFLGDTHSTSPPASGLGVLTSHPNTPVMPQATVSSDFLESLQIFPELVLQLIGQNLGIFPITMVLLSIQKPVRNFILSWVLHDGNDPLNLTSPQMNHFSSVPHLHSIPPHHSVLLHVYSCLHPLSCTPDWHSAFQHPVIHVHWYLLSLADFRNTHLDRSQAKHDLGPAINIGVQHTKNVLKLLWCDHSLQN